MFIDATSLFKWSTIFDTATYFIFLAEIYSLILIDIASKPRNLKLTSYDDYINT